MALHTHRKARPLGIILIAGLLILGMAAGLTVFQKGREQKKRQQLETLKEILIPIRFIITQRDQGKIRTEFRFYSIVMEDINEKDVAEFAEGREINSAVYELEGTELFIDCLKFQENAGFFSFVPDHQVYWVFPYRLFTDYIAPDEGVPIFSCYDEEGFPGIYREFPGLDRELLSRAYGNIKEYGEISDSDLRNRITGNAVHDMNRIARFRMDNWYDLVVHIKKGTIEFVSE
jgi:hypothetical protein